MKVINEETLEQAAKNTFKGEYICNGIDIVPAWREGFVTGAKWQQERMYGVIDEYVNDVMGGCNLRFEEWFEQFKNK